MSFKEYILQKVLEREGKKMLDKLEGKKTYVVMAAAIILSAIDGYNSYCNGAGCHAFDVPSWAYAVLASLGIYTRSVAKPKA